MTNYGQFHAPNKRKKNTPQTEKIPGREDMARNSAGGFSFVLDNWARLDRFLILGVDGPTYYASQKKLVKENVSCLEACIQEDGIRTVNRIAEISRQGRAPKNDSAIFALAMCAKTGDDATRRAARAAIPEVCRIGTHLFHFARDVELFGGWGKGTAKAVAKWYTDRPVEKVAYQAIKYQARDGWSHRDLLRLSHPKTSEKDRNGLFQWIVSGTKRGPLPRHGSLAQVRAFEKAKKATSVKEIVKLIEEFDLPRECVPTQFLNKVAVWEALLQKMPMTAMIRNLAKMTNVGLLTTMSDATQVVLSQLGHQDAITRARVHPMAVLAALLTYKQGRGVRGSMTWVPVPRIVSALDEAFYLSFGNVVPMNKPVLLALDVSGSMGAAIHTVPGLDCRTAAAAMALVTARTESRYQIVGFTSGRRYSWGWGAPRSGAGTDIRGRGIVPGITELDFDGSWKLDKVVEFMNNLDFGGTDCSLPFKYAEAARERYEGIFVYTDNETYAGTPHPSQALQRYRDRLGVNTRSVVVGMTATNFTIADPADAGMLDVVGFDTATPNLISAFVRGD